MPPSGATLRERLRAGGVLAVPGVIDAMTARLAAGQGFRALFMTGAGVAASVGVFDGLCTLSEIADRVRAIARATDAPLIVDADSGGLSDDALRRTVRELELAGAAGLIIEDQIPGLLKLAHVFIGRGESAAADYAAGGSTLFSVQEMCRRIEVACAARNIAATVIVARSDVMALEGVEGAVARGNAYAHAGADLVFLQQPRSLAEVGRLGEGLQAPLVINTSSLMASGVTTRQLGEAGVKLALYTNMALRIGWQAMRDAFEQLAAHGTFGPLLERMMPYSDYLRVIDPQPKAK